MQILRAAFGLSVSVACAAQTVHFVGPGGFAQIGDAVAAATDGDIVRVAAGVYEPFVCGKSLTIAADPGANVVVQPLFFNSSSMQFHLPNGHAVVRGLHFESVGFFQTLPFYVTGGTVAFERCRWTGAQSLAEAIHVSTAGVLFRACDVRWNGDTTADGEALWCQDARVVAVDSSFVAGDGHPSGGNGGAGIRAANTTLHLVRCHVEGGDAVQFSCYYSGGDGVVTDLGRLAWIVDSVVIGGDQLCSSGNGLGGAGVRVTGGGPVRLTRTAASAGVGTPPGSAIEGAWQSDQAIGLASSTTDVTIGAPYRVDYLATPNAVLFVFASFGLKSGIANAAAETTWLPSGEQLWFGSVIADAAGLASLQATVPNVAALRDLAVWLHAVDPAALPLRMAPPVGGVMQ